MVRQSWGSHTLDIVYDNNNRPWAMFYDGTKYFYQLNLQGDVIGIIDTTGASVAKYAYDAWGRVVYSTGTLANINPLRYRGYYYDTELQMYYLGSRYYDPQVKRFINADHANLIAANTYGLTDKNYFSYCDNNPVMRIDDGGGFWGEVLTGVAIIAGVTAVAALAVVTGGISVGVVTAVGGGSMLTASISSAGATALAVSATAGTISISSGYYANKISDIELFGSASATYGSTLNMSKGGRQNIRDSGLAGVSDHDIDQLLRNPSTSKAEKQRLRKEQKARGTRNKQKRRNGWRESDR